MLEPTLAIGTIGFLIILGVLIFGLSEKTKIPHVLVLILIGIIIGPVLHFFDPAEYANIVHPLVTFALVIVLFDAGYEIKFYRLKKEISDSLRLTLPAMILSIVVAVLFSIYFFNFTLPMALLLAAIIASTDITIIAPLIRAFEIKPKIKDVLQLEATINSVLAIIIATAITGLAISGSGTLYEATQTFLYQIFVGIGLGVVFGYIFVFVLKHIKIEEMPEVLSIGTVLLIYAVSKFVGASGIFAVFIAGLIFGNVSQTKIKKVVKSFQSGISFLIIIFIYVILGSMLKLSVLLSAGLAGVIFAILIALSRAPAAWSYKFDWGDEDKFLFLVGPRGITCVVLALFFAEKFADSDLVLGIVFITILTTIILASIAHKFAEKKALKKGGKKKKRKRKKK
ncbi:hypothetical protein GF374_00130 [Candidatus Woesearchaeota archaeon]|nr:hypothetical protein [Candidatus Woesearchaeota archaeon]